MNKYPSIFFAFGIRRYLISFLYFDSVNKYVAFFVAHFPYIFAGWLVQLVLKLFLCLYYSISFDSNLWLFIIIILVYCLVFVEFMMIEF